MSTEKKEKDEALKIKSLFSFRGESVEESSEFDVHFLFRETNYNYYAVPWVIDDEVICAKLFFSSNLREYFDIRDAQHENCKILDCREWIEVYKMLCVARDVYNSNAPVETKQWVIEEIRSQLEKKYYQE